MDRYSEVTNKNQREIVLLKAFPCKWGKCSFCDYILDNSNDEEEINKMGTEKISKLMITMGLPMILSMVVQAFYNIVDSYFVSAMPDTDKIVGVGEYAVYYHLV